MQSRKSDRGLQILFKRGEVEWTPQLKSYFKKIAKHLVSPCRGVAKLSSQTTAEVVNYGRLEFLCQIDAYSKNGIKLSVIGKDPIPHIAMRTALTTLALKLLPHNNQNDFPPDPLAA